MSIHSRTAYFQSFIIGALLKMKHKKCYLCSKELVSKNELILNNHKQALDHGEHVFQQAIGGTLIERGILCSCCGNKLGQEVDTPFVMQFKNITSRIYFNRDRSNYKKTWYLKSEYGLIDFKGEAIEVYALGSSVYPAKPQFIKKDKTIYVFLREGLDHRESKKLDKELDKYINSKVRPTFDNFESYEVKKIRNLNGYGSVILESNLNNEAFKKGFAKIATGFAVCKGIPASLLNSVLDFKKKRFRDDLIVIPYYPTTLLEKHIEQIRFITGNWENVFHSIKIKNFGNKLIAYIEIFGVYQVSILLSDKYGDKDIYFDYVQPLFKRKVNVLKRMPDREDFQINYEFKLTKHTLTRVRSEKPSNNLLQQINKDIQQYEADYTKNIDINEHYKKLIKTYYHLINLSNLPKKHSFFVNGFPPTFKRHRVIIKQLTEVSESEKLLLLRLIEKFSTQPLYYKLCTLDSVKEDGTTLSFNLVLTKSNETLINNRKALEDYNATKYDQFSIFMELYNHQLLEEGCWQTYNS